MNLPTHLRVGSRSNRCFVAKLDVQLNEIERIQVRELRQTHFEMYGGRDSRPSVRLAISTATLLPYPAVRHLIVDLEGPNKSQLN